MGLRAEAGRLLSGRGRISDLFPGSYQTLFRGRGLEFDEVRTYQAGDDYRSLDWRVTARTGRLHTKLFKEEREHTLYLVLDAGPSMHFGTRNCFKWVSAARTAALFAWLAVGKGDRVGAVLFGDGAALHMSRPGAGQAGVLRLFQRLADIPAQARPMMSTPASGLAAALAQLERLIQPGSSILLLSDFLQPDAEAERRLIYLARRNDVLAVQLYDPMERQLPPAGRCALSDGARRLVVDTSDSRLQQAFAARFSQGQEAMAALCRRPRMRFFSLSTAQDLIEGLRAGLNPRPGRSAP